MTTRATDLTPYLVQPGRGDLSFHQGVVTAWDVTTGANTVNVAGTEIPDVPMLNITELLSIAVGDTVALLRYKSTYFILGRVVRPNTPDFFSGVMPDVNTAFYEVNSDAALQTNTVSGYFPKLVGGMIVNHPVSAFGTRTQVSGGAATGAFRVQWYDAHPGNGVNPAGGTLMANVTGLAGNVNYHHNFTYTWPTARRGTLVFVSFEPNLTAGTGGVDWASCVPLYFLGRQVDEPLVIP